jgi:hypothetical protein
MRSMPDLNATCRLFVNGRRDELPEPITELWKYLDELTPRVNSAAQHYEAVSGRPAPSLPCRALSDRIIAHIRLEAMSREERAALPASDRVADSAAPRSDEELIMEGVNRGMLVASIPLLMRAPDCSDADLGAAMRTHFVSHFSATPAGHTLLSEIVTPARCQELAGAFALRMRSGATRVAAKAVEEGLTVDGPTTSMRYDAAILSEARELSPLAEAVTDVAAALHLITSRHYVPLCRAHPEGPRAWLTRVSRELASRAGAHE